MYKALLILRASRQRTRVFSDLGSKIYRQKAAVHICTVFNAFALAYSHKHMQNCNCRVRVKVPIISPCCKYKALPEIILRASGHFGSAEGSCRLGNRKQVFSLLPCFTLVKVVPESR